MPTTMALNATSEPMERSMSRTITTIIIPMAMVRFRGIQSTTLLTMLGKRLENKSLLAIPAAVKITTMIPRVTSSLTL